MATFPSGSTIFRWFDDVRPSFLFDLTTDPSSVSSVRDLDARVGSTLAFKDGDLCIESCHLFDWEATGFLGEMKWFLSRLGVRRFPKKDRRSNSIAWKKVSEVPGRFLFDLSDEEIEILSILGEPSPLLWSDESFRQWVENRLVW